MHALMTRVCSSVNSMNANTRRRDGGIFGGSGAGDVFFFNALFAAGLDYDDTITVTSDHIFSDSSSPKNSLERKCSEKTEQKASISHYTLISTLSALIFHILTKFLALDFR